MREHRYPGLDPPSRRCESTTSKAWARQLERRPRKECRHEQGSSNPRSIKVKRPSTLEALIGSLGICRFELVEFLAAFEIECNSNMIRPVRPRVSCPVHGQGNTLDRLVRNREPSPVWIGLLKIAFFYYSREKDLREVLSVVHRMAGTANKRVERIPMRLT